MPLKYLFTAEYRDGSCYQQSEADVSVSNPIRSCFYDVRQDEVLRFHLVGSGHQYTVDLRDGHFEVDGVPFRFHDEPLGEFRLIFWRQHTHVVGAVGLEERSHGVVYLMGWQTNDENGHNVKRIMAID